MTANTDRCSRSWRGKQWSGKLKGAGSGPAECQASDSCVRLPRHRRSASLTSSMSAERSRSLKTTTLVAWQLSAGSESAALCFLLFAGAVNLRERGQRQTEDAWAEVKWHFQRFGFLAWKAIKKWNRSSSERLWATRAPKHISFEHLPDLYYSTCILTVFFFFATCSVTCLCL